MVFGGVDSAGVTVAYQISRWSEHFETADTRKRHGLEWIKLPIRLSGVSYRRIASRKDGAAVLGVWMALLEVAAQQRMPRDGTLQDGNGRAYSVEDLSLCTSIPEKTIASALSVLQAEGWVISAGDLPDPGRNLPQSAARGEESREEEKREEKRTRSSAAADVFALWNQHRKGLPGATKLTAQRRTRLEALAKEAGGDLGVVAKAIQAFVADPFMRDKRFGLDTLLRHRARWLDAAHNGDPAGAVDDWQPPPGTGTETD